MKICPVGFEMFQADGQTDMVKLVLAFRNFENAPKEAPQILRNLNSIQHFNFQLIHTTLKNIELLEHFKICKTAPTCFGLQGNHHQGATIST